jgi:hypothetical protein
MIEPLLVFDSALSIPGSGPQYFDLYRKKHLAADPSPWSLPVGANIPALAKMLTGRGPPGGQKD